MSDFYVGNARVLDCYASRDFLSVITISGVSVEGGRVTNFAGIVQAIEHDKTRAQGSNWRITILDSRQL